MFAGISSVVLLIAWDWVFLRGMGKTEFIPLHWHGHEMIFSYAVAVIAGFLDGSNKPDCPANPATMGPVIVRAVMLTGFGSGISRDSTERAHGFQLIDDLVDALINRVAVGIDNDFSVFRLLVGRGNTGKLADLSAPRLFIHTLDVTLLAGCQ